MGGSGVWWPQRDLKTRPLSVAEQTIALQKQHEDGIKLYAKIGGYSGSSTRTEIAAGIIATCANGPVHIGSDSEVFVLKAKCIIKHIQNGHANRCNWKLVSDGALSMYNVTRGAATRIDPHSIRISDERDNYEEESHEP